MKLTLLSVILLLGFLVGHSQEKQTDYKDAFNLIDKWMEAQQDYQDLPGITASIVKDQEILWSKAYGMANLENKVIFYFFFFQNCSPHSYCSCQMQAN